MPNQKYRPMYPGFFSDPHLRQYPIEKHFFFAALIGNPETTISGIYPIALDVLAKYGRCTEEQALRWLKEGMRNISFDEENMCVFVHNALYYRLRSQGGNPQWVAQALVLENQSIKTPLWVKFCEVYNIPKTPTPPHYTITTQHYTRVCKRICNPSQKVYRTKEKPSTPVNPSHTRFKEVWFELYKKSTGQQRVPWSAKEGTQLNRDVLSKDISIEEHGQLLASYFTDINYDLTKKNGFTIGGYNRWLEAVLVGKRVGQERDEKNKQAVESVLERIAKKRGVSVEKVRKSLSG